MSDIRIGSLLLVVALGLGACATAPPPAAPAKEPDEFQGFAALRGEPKEKKKAESDDKAEPKADAKTDPKADDKADPKADAKPDAKGDDKVALSKEQVLGAINGAQKRVQGCFKRFKDPGIYAMQITIAPAGTCTTEPIRAPTRKEQPQLWADVAAGVDGGKDPKSPTSRCLAKVFTSLKFPAFDGKPVVVTYPLILR